MDVETNLQLIMCILLGLIIYITIIVFFVTYTFNRAFQSYNQKFEYLKQIIIETQSFRETCKKEEIEGKEEIEEIEEIE